MHVGVQVRVVVKQSETCLSTPGIYDFLPETFQSSMASITVNHVGPIGRHEGLVVYFCTKFITHPYPNWQLSLSL